MAEEPKLTSTTPTTASNIEATNAAQFTQVLSDLADGQADQSAEVVAKVNEIAVAIGSDIIGGSTGTTDNRILISKGTGGRALEASGASADTSGNINTNGGDLTVDDITCDDIAAQDGTFSSTLTKGGVNVAIVNQSVCVSFCSPYPENVAFYLVLNAPFAWTVTSSTVITLVGTATVEFFINAVALGGGPNSATTSQSTVSHASANVVGTTTALAVQFSSVSSDCAYLTFTVAGTRVLA